MPQVPRAPILHRSAKNLFVTLQTIGMSGIDIDLAAFIQPGDSLLWGQGTGEPRALTEALVEQRQRLGGVHVLLGVSYSDTFQPEHADYISFRAMGGYGTNERLSRAGVLQVIPCHASAVPSLISDGTIPVDVVFLQISPSDGAGRHSLGLVADHIRAAINRARVVIAEVNERIPWTMGETLVEATELDAIVLTSRAPIEVPPPRIGAVELAIGALLAERIPNGATLQLGLGAVPEAICLALRDKADLGIHSGILTDGLLDLIRRGVITNRRKTIDQDVAITAALFGTQDLYDYAHENLAIQLRPVTYTHAGPVIQRLSTFISVNSAFQVDLSGQVNAESVDGVHLGAVGGAVDFARGAAMSDGGRSIVALPATARSGRVSRIVHELDGGVTSTPRSDVDLIVTEFGVAELRGRSLPERARRLTAIAHPAFRAELEEAAARIGFNE
jgi:acyl-CoA hydrolase